jgi:hypothetical protein
MMTAEETREFLIEHGAKVLQTQMDGWLAEQEIEAAAQRFYELAQEAVACADALVELSAADQFECFVSSAIYAGLDPKHSCFDVNRQIFAELAAEQASLN